MTLHIFFFFAVPVPSERLKANGNEDANWDEDESESDSERFIETGPWAPVNCGDEHSQATLGQRKARS